MTTSPGGNRGRGLFAPLSDADLTPQQRGWVPRDTTEAYGQWPIVGKVEMQDATLTFSADGVAWDWRSVAAAVRAFPGWRVALLGLGTLMVRQPGPRLPAGSDDTAGDDAAERVAYGDGLQDRIWMPPPRHGSRGAPPTASTP